MSLVAFDKLFPAVRASEYQMLSLPEELAILPEIPATDYLLREYYCVQPRCDCRRVVLDIITEKAPGVPMTIGTFNFGWERPLYYKKWARGRGDVWKELSGVTLESGSKHCRGAEKFAGYLQHLLKSRAELTAHYRRHYQ